MIDGKPYKTLRRHLSTHGLTPEDYRKRYNPKPDYPMVAENYSKQRRDMAKKIGLGQKGRNGRGTADAADPPKRGGGSRPPKEDHSWSPGWRHPMGLAQPARKLSRRTREEEHT